MITYKCAEEGNCTLSNLNQVHRCMVYDYHNRRTFCYCMLLPLLPKNWQTANWVLFLWLNTNKLIFWQWLDFTLVNEWINNILDLFIICVVNPTFIMLKASMINIFYLMNNTSLNSNLVWKSSSDVIEEEEG